MESSEADFNLEKAVKAAFPVKSMLVFFLAGLVVAASVDAAVEVISLNYRSAPEVLPLVKSMLSPEGRISADERTNSLIIVDSEEAIARINSVYRVPGKNCWRNPMRSVSTLQTKTAGSLWITRRGHCSQWLPRTP